MKNAINFFYNMNIDNLIRNNDDYYFRYKNKKFVFHKIDDMTIDYSAIYRLNQVLLGKHYPFFRIVLNKNEQIITTIQFDKYILMVDNDINDKIYDFYDLLQTNVKIEKPTKEFNSLIRTNWNVLWIEKIDYLEKFVNHNINKYYDIQKYINYFIGMAENSISYLNYILNTEKFDMSSSLVVSHKRVNINSFKDLYNPLNLVIDHFSRDIAEYLKSAFFHKETDVYDFVDEINLSREDVFCIIARLMFPSHFFDLFERLVLDKMTEKDILRLIDTTHEYEIYLLNIINKFKKRYNILEINWLKKADYSSALTTPRTSGISLTNIDSIPSFSVTSIMLQ
jgi:hypothetical protein